MTDFVQTATGASARGGFADKPVAKFARSLFPAFARLAPNAAANVALKLFLSPPRVKTPGWERPFMESAATGTLSVYGRPFCTYSWGNGERSIVLCHSWGGRASQLGNFIGPLTAAGFRVIGFDAPAHGASAGKQTDMMEYSAAINAVVTHFGPVHGILGHSFGAGNSLFAWEQFGFEVSRMALIGCFSSATGVTERFGEILGIPEVVLVEMRAALERRHEGKLNWASLDIGRFAQNYPGELLMVHDRDDHEIPYFHAEKIIESATRPGVTLMSTSKKGHRRILRDQQVIARVTEFFGTSV
jgi:pimeloyl-ACP methyl ester carboxylesterase